MKNAKQIEKLHHHYLDILMCLLRVNHPNDRLILPRVIGVLTELRNLTNLYYKTSSQANGNLPLIKNSAPLLLEMVTGVEACSQ